MYAIALLGNFTILFIVKTELSLHGPMYYFLCMLAVTDLVLSTSILPKTLGIFWFNSREIDFSVCLTQLYFIHCFSVMESGIFVAMALDRYVAICHPLRHSSTLTNPMVAKIGLAIMVHGGILVMPHPLLAREIDFSVCLTQLYFIHCFSVMESGIFVAMALDRYVAICLPLRHSSTLTNPMVAKIGLAIMVHGGILVMPHPLLARWQPYCRTNIIPHTHCEHMAVVNLACADIHISSYYGLFMVFCVLGLDEFFVALSYTQILRAIFNLPTKDARLKTFGICGSHLCAILTFYISALFSSLTYQFGKNVALHFHVFTANVYILVPPMLNPIIYGVRTILTME
ncbi:Olfactory receptor 52R1 [Chelonia mydas]|uniref:Olfactory receptor 52R1 n=1 Tax=Chelonia mydas TaxID=8469 RepID=M7B031_CHEMY|nr:Olfactory receptor 52R1 [Chelonia mydas]